MYFVQRIEINYEYLMKYFHLKINEKTLYNNINRNTNFFEDNDFESLNMNYKKLLIKYLSNYEIIQNIKKGMEEIYKKLNIDTKDLYNYINCHKIIIHLNKLKKIYNNKNFNDEICLCYIYLYKFKCQENKIAMYFNKKK